VADPVVDLLEVVEVEDDQRQPPLVPMGARDLPRQRLMEVAAVVEARERVEVGELPGFAEAASVLDRRPARTASASSSRTSSSSNVWFGVRVKIVR
jgi:hypothetical protein